MKLGEERAEETLAKFPWTQSVTVFPRCEMVTATLNDVCFHFLSFHFRFPLPP